MPRGNGTTRQVPVKELVRDPRLQSRAGGLNEDHAADMAEWLKDKAVTPRKVEVRKVTTEGGDEILYVVDGFHTCTGAERSGRKTVPCNILSGTWEDALLDAAGANTPHVGVSHTFVADIIAPKSGNVAPPPKPVAGRKPLPDEPVAEKTGDWRDVPVKDFLNALPYVWTALGSENVNTAGRTGFRWTSAANWRR